VIVLAQADSERSLWDNRVLDQWEIPFGDWMDQLVDWIFNNLRGFLNTMAWPFDTLIDGLVNGFLAEISWVWVVLGMFVIASLVRNVKVGVFVAVALTICGLLGNAYWLETARTIGFIAVAVILCVIIGIPIGIACGRVDSIWQVVRPILDAMQVVHSFVYMLPFIFFWGIGEVSATMVTMVFALPPLIRLTNLGIRQVPSDVVEASRAYGARESRVLVDVQLPLARPAIMTGINQTLLLAISMLGIAAIMGAGGLGRLLFRALSNQDVSLAASGGLAFFLVAVVLDRMSQREDSDSGNLFRRIHLAWAHRQDPEALLPDDTDASPIAKHEPVDSYEPVANAERTPMLVAGVGALLAVVAVFLTWTSNAGKMSAYGRRVDEDLPGMSFNGLDASGGSWFGIVVLALSLIVLGAVVATFRRPGHGPRWLTVDGAVIVSVGAFTASAANWLAPASPYALEQSTGIGAILAVVGTLIALAGSIWWIQVAPHSPLRPLSADIAWGRLIGVGIALIILVIGMISGWSFDSRQDTIISPEIEQQIADLRARAASEPENAGAIAAELSTLMAQTQRAGTLVTDGISGDGPRLGLWALLAGIVGALTALPAAGLFGRNEHIQWRWSAITAGLGTGAAAVAFGWILTHVRTADPNYVSGIGSFITLAGGFFILASTLSVLKEFRRSKVYDDFSMEVSVHAADADAAAVEELV